MEKNIRILPFNGNEQSWHEWSAKFMARADMLGYSEALMEDSASPRPRKKKSGDEDGLEVEYNKAAYNQLILCCEGRAFNIVNNAKSEKYPRGDAALAWTSLKRRYQIETAAGKMELKQKFANSKLRRGQDPDEWLLELELLRIRLANMGSLIADEDFITHVINNLTQDYSELVTSLEGALEELRIGVLKERILSFHRRKSATEYTELHYAQSHNRKQLQSPNGKPDHKTGRGAWRPERNQCYWCLKKGHTVAQCKQRLSGKGSTRRPDGTYYQGKLSREMSEKRTDQSSSFAAASFCLETTGTEIAVNSTLISEGIAEIGREMWLVDSGCNQHISPFREDFQDLRPTIVTCIF